MFEFVTQKMWNKKWMMLCLIIGNVLMIAVASCNPMYTNAIQQKTLKTKMANYIIENNKYPGEIRVDSRITSDSSKTYSESFYEAKDKVDDIKRNFGVKLLESVVHYNIPENKCSTESTYNGSVANKELTIGMLENFEKHIRVVSGELYKNSVNEEGIIEAVISQKGLVQQKLLVGEVLVFKNMKDDKGNPVKVKITGVFENSKDEDLFWVNSPSTFTSEIIISSENFMKLTGDFKKTQYKINAAWHLMFDYEQMKETKINGLMAKIKSYQNFFSQSDTYALQIPCSEILQEHVTDSRRVNSTLIILQVPIFVLLAAFIFMVSGQILKIEQDDISIIKSRGASKKQILTTYLIQSGLMAAGGLVLGIPIGMMLCQIFGSSNAFLEFVQRRALSISLTWSVLFFSLGAVVISVIAMIIPAVSYADLSIVETKQKKGNNKKKVWWKKYYLDFAMLAVSLYGLYAFYGQKEAMAKKIAEGGSLDPLMFLSSSLFILGAGLVAIRLIPWLIRLVFYFGRKKWNPAVYASFLQVLRTTARQHFIMIFLILTIGLGIFNARSARTINTNEENRIQYRSGADVVLMEQWADKDEEKKTDALTASVDDEAEADDSSDNSSKSKDAANKEETAVKMEETTDKAEISADKYTEPDIEKYKKIKGVTNLARVYVSNQARITIETSKSKINDQNATLMGINTKDFGETAWFDGSLLPQHWYHYLNAISQNTSAILVSSNFKNKLGYKLGEVLSYKTEAGHNVRGVIYGFVDYWPGYNPIITEENSDGSKNEQDNFLIVAHLRKIQNVDGVLPYQVWLKVSGSTQPVYNFIGEKKLKLESFLDTKSDLIEMKNDPIIQGTNGTLTVGFIVVLLLSSVGFLIFWILSIQSRFLQFGIYRAMGMTMKEVLQMLISEQILITIPALLAGSLIGALASKLYIPLIQIAYTSSEQILPVKVVMNVWDIVKLYSVVVVVIGICMVILGWLISKIKIAQALKLGED